MRKEWIVCLTVTLVLGSCVRKSQREEGHEYPIKVELVKGLKTIVNPDYPRDGFFKYDLIEEISIGSNDPNEESVLNRPVVLKVDPAGRIHVLDLSDINIKVFNPDGTLSKTIGRPGQGPGEFRGAANFDITEAGLFLVYDGMSRRILTLNQAGRQISAFKVEGYGREIVVGPADDIYFTRTISPEINVIGEEQIVQQRRHLYRVDMNGKLLHDFGEIPGIKMRLKVTGKNNSTTVSSPEAYTSVWTVSPHGILFLGYNDEYRLDAYDADGSHLFRFGREFVRMKHPGYRNDGVAPEYYPAFYSRYHCFDDEGNLWLRQYMGGENEQAVYDVFNPEGIYIEQNSLPNPILKIQNDKAYSIIVTEDEFRVVKRFRMIRSSG